MMDKATWTICVNGYGSFNFAGTEEEAEEMRRHKARWEQGVARKHAPEETCPICRKQGGPSRKVDA